MKTPLAAVFTDIHMHRNNIEQSYDLIRQLIELCNELKIKKVFCAGDVFTEKKAQEEMVLNAWGNILNMFMNNGIELYAIPGNHDKIDLKSEKSYLTPFKYHPNFHLFELAGGVPLNKNLFVDMLPYFEDSLYKKRLQELVEYRFDDGNVKADHFLITHQAFNGAINNDGTKVENDFDKINGINNYGMILCGHYHNRNSVGNVLYIGSICQNNFGENSNKGFTVIYDNGDVDFFKAKFKEFKKISIDIDKLSVKELNQEISQYIDQKNDNNIRFELIGDDKKLNSLDIESYKKLGFDIKTKSKEIQVHIDDVQSGQRIEFTNESLVDEFDKFCKLDEIKDIETGKKYLNKIM